MVCTWRWKSGWKSTTFASPAARPVSSKKPCSSVIVSCSVSTMETTTSGISWPLERSPTVPESVAVAGAMSGRSTSAIRKTKR